MSTPHLRRRAFLPLLPACLLPAAVLSACGGSAEREELLRPELLQEEARLSELAQAAVATGLVGAMFGSQFEGAHKLYLGCAGLSQQGQNTALSRHHAMQLGSLGKSMTAALAAELVRQGKLRWDSRPAELLPDLAPILHPGYANITLRQMLDHRSGMPAFQEPSELAELADYLAIQTEPLPQTDRERRQLLARWVLARPPATAPGGELLYSNAGYTLAGAMLEAASGQDFNTLLLHWTRGLGLDFALSPPTHAPQGHVGPKPQALKPYQALAPEWSVWVDGALQPSGNVWLSAAGYGRWLAEHQRAFQGHSHGLAPDYIQALRQLPAGEYSLGWVAMEIKGKRSLVHTGAYAGFMGMVLLQLDGKRACFGLSNTEGNNEVGDSWVLDALNHGVLQAADR
ncbi:serine hydrolase domain-containing protein [Paucibacter sp. B51]|uniref:serine hydrolase domain-containing protein n=1 Tax=Paucibacter sp. B51 TaxID=2993315 RepID=UPI0022EBB73E|nr:serine hydrolase domain-containing protein [Paucibacter sp. B51]